MFRLRRMGIDTLSEHVIFIAEQAVAAGALGFKPLDRVRVIARDEVFGTVSPSDARIGTTIMVVRLPGIPPMQCLSATTFASNESREPQAIIDSVNAISSPVSRRRSAQASTNIASSGFA